MKMFWGAPISHRGGKHLYMPIVSRNGSMVYLSLCGGSMQTVEPVHGFRSANCSKCELQARAIGVNPAQLRSEREHLALAQARLLEQQRQIDILLAETGFEVLQEPA